MSYIRRYFDDEEVNGHSISDYEKSFKKIYAHGDRVYENEDGRGRILSFSSTMTTLTEDEEEKLIDYGEHGEEIEIEIKELTGEHMPRSSVGQTDRRFGSSTNLPVVVVNRDGHERIRYEPITRTFLVPDIYHNINDYTMEYIKIMRMIEMRWSRTRDTLPESERDKKAILMDGDMYEMKLVKRNITNTDKARDRYEKQIDDLRNEIERIRARSNIRFSDNMIQRFQERGIGAYPMGGGTIMLAKHFECDVDSVYDSRQNRTQPVKLDEEEIETIEGSLYIKGDVYDQSDNIFPINVRGVYLDIPHPHRGNGNSDYIESLCTGEINVSRLENIDEADSKFKDLTKALKTIYLTSIMDTGAKINGKYRERDYRRMHFKNAPEIYSYDDQLHYADRFELDLDEILERGDYDEE